MKNEKVLLLKNVKSLGKEGEILEVKKSYALNFLIPTKKAIKIKNSEDYIIKKEKEEKLKENIEYKKIENFFDSVEKQGLKFNLKKQNEKIFGSIKSSNVLNILNKISKDNNFGFKINEKNLIGFNEIKSSGTYNIEIKIKKLTKNIQLKVTLI